MTKPIVEGETQKPGPDGASKYTPEFIAQLVGKLRDYTNSVSYPIWAEFCYKNRITRGLRKHLTDQSPELLDAYEEMMAKQEGFLHRAGVSGKTNSGFVKFILINNHKKDDGAGYRDKTDHELSGPGGAPLAPPQIIFEDVKEKDAPQ